MDYNDDEDLKKSVLDQMMGELDNEHVNDLNKPAGPVKGVEITISVAPKTEDEIPDEVKEAAGMAEGGEVENFEKPVCMNPDCEDTTHDHSQIESKPSENYIQELLKQLNDDERDD